MTIFMRINKYYFVAIFGILLIFSNVIDFYRLYENYSLFSYKLKYFYTGFQKVAICAHYLIEVFSIIAAILLLKKNELGRKLVIIAAVLYILNYFMGTLTIDDKSLITISRVLLDVLLPALYIYVFTRDSIKKVFVG